MEYGEIREMAIKMAELNNVSRDCFDYKYTLYYDETGNFGNFILHEDSFNVDADSLFVLGGIEADDVISSEDLKKAIEPRMQGDEVKSAKVFKGNFQTCLGSYKLENFLDLVIIRGWHFHFQVLNPLYWSIVDILDSIDGFEQLGVDTKNVKSMLYSVVKANLHDAISIFHKYQYPNLKTAQDVHGFMGDMLHLVLSYKEPLSLPVYRFKVSLICLFIIGMNQDAAIFIQDEKDGELLKQLTEFYKAEIYTFTNSTLRFDRQNQIENELKNDPVVVNENIMENYSFIDSKSNAMIQCSDIAVSIISKYLRFIDLNSQGVTRLIEEFSEDQMRRFSKLNQILKSSLDYNPAFFHQTNSVEVCTIFSSLVDKYGNNNC